VIEIGYWDDTTFINSIAPDGLIESGNVQAVSGDNILKYKGKENSKLKTSNTIIGGSFYLGQLIKDITVKYKNGFQNSKDNGDVRNIYVRYINYIDTNTIYISWAIEKTTTGEDLITGVTYYIPIGTDTSNVAHNYDFIISWVALIEVSLVLDISFLSVGDTFTTTSLNGSLSKSTLINGYVEKEEVYSANPINLEGIARYNGSRSVYFDKDLTNLLINFNNKTLFIGSIFRDLKITFSDDFNLKREDGTYRKIYIRYINYIDVNTFYMIFMIENRLNTSFNETAGSSFYIPITGDNKYVDFSISKTVTGIGESGTITFSGILDISFLSIAETASILITQSKLSEDFILTNYNSDFDDKNFVIFGDSITTLGWVDLFKSYIKPANIENYARSGQVITWQAGTVETATPPMDKGDDNVLWNSIKKWEATTPKTPDFIIISLLTNDIYYNWDLGTYADAFAQTEALTSQLTMAGALRKALYYLMNNYPSVQIYFCLPIESATVGREYASLLTASNIANDVAKRMNTIIIDNLHKSGIQEEFEVSGGVGRYLYDGTHPNSSGNALIAKSVYMQFLNNYKI